MIKIIETEYYELVRIRPFSKRFHFPFTLWLLSPSLACYILQVAHFQCYLTAFRNHRFSFSCSHYYKRNVTHNEIKRFVYLHEQIPQ